MKIEIEIPKEFEADYKGDTFKDFFSRVLCDIDCEGMCGNYEKDIAKMLIEAFDKSKPAYDVDKVVKELEGLRDKAHECFCIGHDMEDMAEYNAFDTAIEIVKAGGVDDY